MKNSQKGFALSLLIVIIATLLIGGGAYVYVQNKQASQPAAENSTAQATSTTQTSNSQTADWKTYTNTKYGFEIKYPTIWNANPCQDFYIRFGTPGEIKAKSCSYEGYGETLPLPDYPRVTIAVGINPEITVPSAIENAKTTGLKDITQSEINIDGIKATVIQGRILQGGSKGFIDAETVVVAANGYTYIFEYGGSPHPEYLELFNNMVSTVKFLKIGSN